MAVSLSGLLVSSITGSLLLFRPSSSRERLTLRRVRNAAAWGCR
jgi:hypothetical protein